MNSINKVNNLNKSDFISIFGNVFEKTEWIAAQTYALKPFNNFEELFSRMMEIFESSKKKVNNITKKTITTTPNDLKLLLKFKTSL